MKHQSLIFILSASVFFSCSVTKKVSFKITDNHGRKFNYQLNLPKGFKLIEMNYENERAKVFVYPDSSRVFFSDNIKPSAFYPDAYKKYGKDLNLKFLSNDTISINGVDEKGRYWDERKIKNIVYGYIQVPVEKKVFFDKILESIVVK